MHTQRPRLVETTIASAQRIYFDALLPELACPRHGKGGIREPSTASKI